MESEVIRIEEMFGTGPVSVEYSWMPKSYFPDHDFPCRSSIWGCSVDSDVYSRTLLSTHELVHAARVSSLPPVLEEGLANLLSAATSRSESVMAPREMLWEALAAGTWAIAEDPHGIYERSAHFVSFLFAQYGRELFLEFEQRTRRNGYQYRPLSGWTADFEAVYGEPFEQVWASYASYPDCPPAQYHLPLTECAMLGNRPADASLSPGDTFTRALECDSDEVAGPFVFFPESRMRFASYRVDIDNDRGGAMGVELVGAVNGANRVILTNCGNCWEGSAAYLSSEHRRTSSRFQSGPHALLLYRDLEATSETGITLSRDVR